MFCNKTMGELWCIHTMKYYASIKNINILTQGAMWINQCIKSQTQKVTFVWLNLCEISTIGKSTDAESGLVVARQGNGDSHGISFGGEKNALELDRDDGCTTL